MKFKQITLIVMIFSYASICDSENSGLIITGNVDIYNSSSENARVITKCNEFENIMLASKEVSKGKIKIITSKNINGWVDFNKTSYIPKDWMIVNDLRDLQFNMPKTIKYKSYKGVENNDNMHIKIEDKIFAHDICSFISLIKILNNYKSYIANFKETIFKGEYIKKINYNGKIIYYHFNPRGINQTIEENILFKTSNGYLYEFLLVSDQETNQSIEKQLIMRKILFSILENAKLESL